MSAGDGGTLLASGTLGATLTETPFIVSNAIGSQSVYTVSGSIAGLDLAAGDYFLTVAVVGSGSGSALIVATNGANGVGGPLSDGVSFFDSPYFGSDFAPTTGSVFRDYSMGLNGVAATPGPLAAVPFALGLLRRRRKA